MRSWTSLINKMSKDQDEVTNKINDNKKTEMKKRRENN